MVFTNCSIKELKNTKTLDKLNKDKTKTDSIELKVTRYDICLPLPKKRCRYILDEMVKGMKNNHCFFKKRIKSNIIYSKIDETIN